MSIPARPNSTRTFNLAWNLLLPPLSFRVVLFPPCTMAGHDFAQRDNTINVPINLSSWRLRSSSCLPYNGTVCVCVSCPHNDSKVIGSADELLGATAAALLLSAAMVVVSAKVLLLLGSIRKTR